MLKPNPCRDCEERNTRCHTACEEYSAWRALKDEYNAATKKAKDSFVNMPQLKYKKKR